MEDEAELVALRRRVRELEALEAVARAARAPIELDEGWLLLTHGVGAMRQYAIGAVLLDRDDPSKILGRTRHPILTAEDDDRNGYVPNVVYTCGAMKVGDQLFMPYGISDSSIGFAFLPLTELLAAMS